MTQNLSRMNVLLNTQEDVTNGFGVVENEIKQRYQKIQEELKKTFDVCLEEFNKQQKEQQMNASQKMDDLCRQQDRFKNVQENLDSVVKPPTIDTFHEYECLVSDMKKLNRIWMNGHSCTKYRSYQTTGLNLYLVQLCQ